VAGFRGIVFTSPRIGLIGMGIGGGALRRLCSERTALLKVCCGVLSLSLFEGVEVDIVMQLQRGEKAMIETLE
jgi:hypothetical protein